MVKYSGQCIGHLPARKSYEKFLLKLSPRKQKSLLRKWYISSSTSLPFLPGSSESKQNKQTNNKAKRNHSKPKLKHKTTISVYFLPLNDADFPIDIMLIF